MADQRPPKRSLHHDECYDDDHERRALSIQELTQSSSASFEE